MDENEHDFRNSGRYGFCVCGESMENYVAQLEAENLKLRELLWLRHGCSALYGDDGEMQCAVCVLDFKRQSPQEIEKRFEAQGRAAYDAIQRLKGAGGEMITVEQFKGWHNFAAEQQALAAMVDAFAFAMKKTLYWKTMKGEFGWDNPQNRGLIEGRLIEHVNCKEAQWIDIANLAAMLWNFEQPNDGRSCEEEPKP